MTTALKFRNLTASPDDPVEDLAIRGNRRSQSSGAPSLTGADWLKSIQADPMGSSGPTSPRGHPPLSPHGIAELLEGVIHSRSPDGYRLGAQ